jgi:hypothetical protein
VSVRRSHSSRSRNLPSWVLPLALGVGAVVVLLVVVSAIAVLHALRLEHRVNGVPTIVQTAEVDAENGQLAAATAQLQQAEADLTSVNSSLYNSPDFSIVHLLPVGRQNIDAIRRSVNLGLQMVGGGEQILQSAAPLESTDGHLEIPLNGGQIPLATTEAVGAALTDVITSLPASAHISSSPFVLGRVSSLEQRVYTEAYERRRQLESVDVAVRLVNDIAGGSGDRRYLIAVANSAEMRGSGGMILSYGVLTSAAGKVSLAAFGPIDQLALSQPETKVSFPADFLSQDGYLAPTQVWRNVNLMSDFTVDAPVMEAMYTQATGQSLSGVIQIDSAGLGAVLSGIGPVQTADLGTVTASNVVPLTLSQAYAAYPYRTQRQDYTEEAAQATFAKLTSGKFAGLRALGSALVQAGKSRHVLMYTNDPTDESIIEALGFDGAMPSPSSPLMQLTVQNLGGNKLDYYLHTSVNVTGSRPSPQGSTVTATISIANDAPAGQTVPQVVYGPGGPGEVAGEYYGLVTLYLPANSYLKGHTQDPTVTTGPGVGSQNGIATVSFTVDIPPGGATNEVLTLAIPPLPAGTTGFTFVPTPRVIPTTYTQKFS